MSFLIRSSKYFFSGQFTRIAVELLLHGQFPLEDPLVLAGSLQLLLLVSEGLELLVQVLQLALLPLLLPVEGVAVILLFLADPVFSLLPDARVLLLQLLQLVFHLLFDFFESLVDLALVSGTFSFRKKFIVLCTFLICSFSLLISRLMFAMLISIWFLLLSVNWPSLLTFSSGHKVAAHPPFLGSFYQI